MIEATKVQYQPLHCILESEGGLCQVYLGDIKAALDLELIQSMSINTVITAADGFQHLKYPSSIKHIKYPLLDHKSELISKYFLQSFQIIESSRQNGNVLVHCAAGVSRSATLVIAYLMYKKCWTFKKAIEFVREKRSIVCPNLGFEMQLKDYEKVACKKSNSSKSTIAKSQSLSKKSYNSNLPQIYLKPKNNKFLRFKKYTMEIKRSERQLYLESLLNLEDNFRVNQLRTPITFKSQQLYKPLERSKPRSSQLLSKFSY